jgi:hypothetical protein
MGADEAEIIYLNDFRWSPTVIDGPIYYKPWKVTLFIYPRLRIFVKGYGVIG